MSLVHSHNISALHPLVQRTYDAAISLAWGCTMSIFDLRRCAHEIQADWIAPPARSVMAVAGHRETYAVFRHGLTSQVLLVAIAEAAELIGQSALLIKRALTSDDQPFEALICYDRHHRGEVNCRTSCSPVLQLALPQAS